MKERTPTPFVKLVETYALEQSDLALIDIDTVPDTIWGTQFLLTNHSVKQSRQDQDFMASRRTLIWAGRRLPGLTARFGPAWRLIDKCSQAEFHLLFGGLSATDAGLKLPFDTPPASFSTSTRSADAWAVARSNLLERGEEHAALILDERGTNNPALPADIIAAVIEDGDQTYSAPGPHTHLFNNRITISRSWLHANGFDGSLPTTY